MVLFDDTIVLKGGYPGGAAKPAGDLVFLGCDPNWDNFGKILRTPVVSVRRLPVAEAAARAENRSSMGLEFKAPRDVAAGAQALLSVAGAGAEHRVDIEYLSDARIRLRYWEEGREVARSDRFPNAGQWRRLDLDQIFDGQRNPIHVRMDRTPIATLPGGRIDLRRDEFRPGWGAPAAAAFTGFIRHAYSEGAPPIRFLPRGKRIALAVVFPRKPENVSEPLLVTGRTAAGDLYEVVYLDQNHISFRQDHWGAGIVRTSPPIAVRFDVPHRIVFDFAPRSPDGAQPETAAKVGLQITLDGREVWEKDAPYHAFNADEFYVGRNTIGGSTCAEEFSGELLSCDMDAAPAPPLRK
jgi:hypothetical protein